MVLGFMGSCLHQGRTLLHQVGTEEAFQALSGPLEVRNKNLDNLRFFVLGILALLGCIFANCGQGCGIHQATGP